MRRCLLFLSTLLSLSCAASVSQSNTTCTAGDYTLGQTAWITCNFPQDIAVNYSIYIEFYPGNHSEKQVLLCSVTKLKQSECSGNEGFVFQNATRNSVTVAILAVTEAAAGQYMCQLVPPDGTTVPMCNLTVTEKEAPWIENRDETTSSPEHQQDSTKTPENGEAPNDVMGTLTIILVVLSLLVAWTILLTLVIIVLIYKSYNQRVLSTVYSRTEQHDVTSVV